MDDRGPASIVIHRRIEWSDTDASGHYHHTAAMRLFEAAETELLARLGILDEIYGRLPRVHFALDFRRVLRFRDAVEVRAAVARVGRSSIGYQFQIVRDGEECASGEVTAALVRASGEGTEPWPAAYRELLTRAGPQ